MLGIYFDQYNDVTVSKRKKLEPKYDPTKLIIEIYYYETCFHPIQDGGQGWGVQSQKGPPTSFSPVTSANVGISLQNFLTFSFNPFATLV